METMALAMALTIDASFGHSRIPSGILHANGKKKSRLKCAAQTTSSESLLARDDLLNLIAGEERGLKTQGNSSKFSQITRAIDALAVFGEDSVATDASSLSATWRMLWTTEKEQLFIVEKAHVFGTKVGDILQAIDVEKGSLNNVITFPPSGAFVVSSTIQIASPKRVNFSFCCKLLAVMGKGGPLCSGEPEVPEVFEAIPIFREQFRQAGWLKFCVKCDRFHDVKVAITELVHKCSSSRFKLEDTPTSFWSRLV